MTGLFQRPLAAEAQAGPTITATPDALTLKPGESAQVTIAVSPASASGQGSVTIPVTVPAPYDGVIVGAFAGIVPAGKHFHITGDVQLTGDLIVEGLLTSVASFILDGNGFQILAQRGGVVDLAGVEKTAWGRWGDQVVGWNVGDRLAVAPTSPNVFTPAEVVWLGSWAATSRPAASPDVTVAGVVKAPEVANLSQSILLRNLRRIHFHDGAGVQSLRRVRVLDSGTTTLGDYPIHFHLNGEASRGSLIEGVVVEGSKHRGFVPHGSHGITMRGCVAYRSQDTPFWWDTPLNADHTANNSNDTNWERCLALYGLNLGVQAGAFFLGAGARNRVASCVASCFDNSNSRSEASGFHWAAAANQNIGGNVWEFTNNDAHNCSNGWRIWQNDENLHHPSDSAVYRNRLTGILHGAYQNSYHVQRITQLDNPIALALVSNGSVKYSDLNGGILEVRGHHVPPGPFLEFTRTLFSQVVYKENQKTLPSKIRFNDCALTPAKFNLAGIVAPSLIEILEGGILKHRWANGAWA